jgi:hypothetical protein
LDVAILFSLLDREIVFWIRRGMQYATLQFTLLFFA